MALPLDQNQLSFIGSISDQVAKQEILKRLAAGGADVSSLNQDPNAPPQETPTAVAPTVPLPQGGFGIGQTFDAAEFDRITQDKRYVPDAAAKKWNQARQDYYTNKAGKVTLKDTQVFLQQKKALQAKGYDTDRLEIPIPDTELLRIEVAHHAPEAREKAIQALVDKGYTLPTDNTFVSGITDTRTIIDHIREAYTDSDAERVRLFFQRYGTGDKDPNMRVNPNTAKLEFREPGSPSWQVVEKGFIDTISSGDFETAFKKGVAFLTRTATSIGGAAAGVAAVSPQVPGIVAGTTALGSAAGPVGAGAGFVAGTGIALGTVALAAGATEAATDEAIRGALLGSSVTGGTEIFEKTLLNTAFNVALPALGLGARLAGRQAFKSIRNYAFGAVDPAKLAFAKNLALAAPKGTELPITMSTVAVDQQLAAKQQQNYYRVDNPIDKAMRKTVDYGRAALKEAVEASRTALNANPETAEETILPAVRRVVDSYTARYKLGNKVYNDALKNLNQQAKKEAQYLDMNPVWERIQKYEAQETNKVLSPIEQKYLDTIKDAAGRPSDPPAVNELWTKTDPDRSFGALSDYNTFREGNGPLPASLTNLNRLKGIVKRKIEADKTVNPYSGYTQDVTTEANRLKTTPEIWDALPNKAKQLVNRIAHQTSTGNLVSLNRLRNQLFDDPNVTPGIRQLLVDLGEAEGEVITKNVEVPGLKEFANANQFLHETHKDLAESQAHLSALFGDTFTKLMNQTKKLDPNNIEKFPVDAQVAMDKFIKLGKDNPNLQQAALEHMDAISPGASIPIRARWIENLLAGATQKGTDPVEFIVDAFSDPDKLIKKGGLTLETKEALQTNLQRFPKEVQGNIKAIVNQLKLVSPDLPPSGVSSRAHNPAVSFGAANLNILYRFGRIFTSPLVSRAALKVDDTKTLIEATQAVNKALRMKYSTTGPITQRGQINQETMAKVGQTIRNLPSRFLREYFEAVFNEDNEKLDQLDEVLTDAKRGVVR